MAEVKIVLTAENATGQGFKSAENTATSAFDKITESAKTWTQFVKERMGPEMKAAMEQGLPHAEAHTAAIRKIAADWKEYKATAIDAVSGVKAEAKSAFNKIGDSSGKIKTGLKEATDESGKLSRSLGNIALPVAAVFSVYKLTSAIKEAISASLEYLKTIETAQLGIASSYTAQGHYIDETTGKVLQGADALKAAQQDSKNMMGELQVANLQTIATLDQLVKAYQETLPVAMAKGFDQKQVKDFTVAMVQAAGAIGLPLDQLGEETRSILTGTINPRTSRIATVLGLRNEDVAQYKDNAQGLFDFLMTKLDAYKTAGEAAQHTWAGLMSNTEDLLKKMGGDAFEPLFEAVKYELEGITESVMTIDEKTGQIKWNEDFVSSIQTIRAGVVDVIAEFYRMGMLLDKVGGTLTTLGYVAAGGPMTRLGKWFEEQNKMFEQRYNESDKALQALANREAGLNSDGSAKAADMKVKYAANEVKESLKEQKKELKETLELFKEYSTVIKEAGKDALKFAESRFSEKMKEQEKSIDGMKDAMKEYEGVINSVYGSQVKALEKIKDAMKGAGADPKEIKAQGIVILEAEKAQATARLGAWQKYYEGLKALQASAITEMQKKIDAFNETKKLKTDFFAGLSEKFHPKEALDPYQQFWNDMNKIDQASTEAMKLEGEDKKKALKDVLKSMENLPKEVTVDGETVISQLFVEEKIREKAQGIIDAMKEVDQAGIDMAANLISESGAAILEAEAKMEGLKNKILEIDDKLKSLALQVNTSQAEAAISSLLNSIPRVVTISAQVNYAGGAAQSVTSPSPWSGQLSGYHMADGGLTPDSAGYAVGTSYVPKTGKYQLHQGEQVLTRSEVTNKQSKSVTVNMGDIHINGANKSTDEIVNEIAKPLQRKLRQLEALQ